MSCLKAIMNSARSVLIGPSLGLRTRSAATAGGRDSGASHAFGRGRATAARVVPDDPALARAGVDHAEVGVALAEIECRARPEVSRTPTVCHPGEIGPARPRLGACATPRNLCCPAARVGSVQGRSHPPLRRPSLKIGPVIQDTVSETVEGQPIAATRYRSSVRGDRPRKIAAWRLFR